MQETRGKRIQKAEKSRDKKDLMLFA